MSDPSGAELEAMIRQRLADLLARPTEAAEPPDELAPEVRDRAARFDAMAAATGRFVPSALFARAEPDDLRRRVLRTAVDRYTVEPTSDGVRWIQSPAVRRDVLRRLQPEELDNLLAEDLPPTDAYGEVLRDILRQGRGVSLDRSVPELIALKGVVDELAGTGLPMPEPDDLRRRIQENAFEREYLPTDPHFVGRRAELRDFHKFLARPKDPSAFPMWAGLVLTGLGGAGKSALLTQLMHDVHRRQLATLVVLDFDRPGIDPGDRAWLNAEASRQVELQHPSTGPDLRTLRHQARQTHAEVANQRYAGPAMAESTRSTDDLLLDAIRQTLEAAGMADRPFLLVLDTLEQVADNDKLGALREWIDTVSSILWQTPVKVIISGRLFDSSLDVFRGWVSGDPVELRELPVVAAERLLRHGGLPRPLAAALARAKRLPRRPLELRLLSRLAAGYSSLSELEQALDAGKTEVSAGVIYRRVLQRLGSDVVGKLASPGLVLRYVTPQIIESVLSPALDLPDLTGPEAEDALERLARHSWLVTRDKQGRVWHRRDLRRSMLQLMRADDWKTSERISRGAARFFAEGSSPDDRVEATYHRLLHAHDPGSDPDIELGDLKDAFEAILPDIDDLPKPAAALLRFAAGRGITPADVELLPEEYFQRAYDKTGRRLVRKREFGQAERLLRRQRAERGGTTIRTQQLADWEWDTLVAVGEWGRITERSYPTQDRAGEVVRELKRAYSAALLGWPVKPDSGQMATIRAAAEAAAEATPGSVFAEDLASAVGGLAFGLVIGHEAAPLGRLERESVSQLLKRIISLEPRRRPALRHHRLFLLGLLADPPGVIEFRPAPSLLPLCPDALLGLAGLPELGSVRGYLKGAAETLRGGGQRRPTAENTLSRIGALYKHQEVWEAASLAIPTDAEARLVGFLRGPDPEFRDPIRFCLLDEFASSPGRRTLADLLRSVLEDVKLTDLNPDAFVAALEVDAERALEAPVELVDRAWRTGPLLDAVCAERPGAERLGRVREAYRRWDRALDSLLVSRFPNYSGGLT